MYALPVIAVFLVTLRKSICVLTITFYRSLKNYGIFRITKACYSCIFPCRKYKPFTLDAVHNSSSGVQDSKCVTKVTFRLTSFNRMIKKGAVRLIMKVIPKEILHPCKSVHTKCRKSSNFAQMPSILCVQLTGLILNW